MGQRLALIIGNSLYSDTTLSRLLTPDVDVGALGEILLDGEIGGFDDVNVLVNMSSTIIRRAIASFYAKRSREDLLLLYFSGHGVLDDQGLLYLAVRDTDSKLLRGTAISANFITEEMNNSRSQRQVLILDCCHSGAFARGTKGAPGSSVGTATAFEGNGYGRVVLTASDATQYAWEGDQVIGDAENSLFTHFVLEGIKSGAADANRDGQITVDELYDYVYENVIRQTPRQTPGKWSYKEQGQIVIARVQPGTADSNKVVKLRDFDLDLDERLDKLYNEGLGAYWLEEWDKAIRCFQAILEVRPDYPDAANKFELSKRQQRLRTIYNQALEAEEDKDWLLAVSRLDELLSLAPDFRDARQRLEIAKRKRLLSDLYTEARQLVKAGKFRAVLNVFAQISKLQPDYPDPDGLLPIAKQEVAAQEHQAELDQIYHQALREMDSGKWQAAEELLRRLQSEEPGYPGIYRLLERAQTERAKEEAARQRNEQITILSQQAVGLARAKQWHQVLAKIEEIRAIDPNYQDSDQLVSTAKAEIECQTQETQHEAQLAEMYAAAVKSLEAGEYQKALQQWGEIQALYPEYPDRKKVQKTAKKKLEELSDPKARPQKFSKWLIIMISLLGALIIIIFGAWLIQNRENENTITTKKTSTSTIDTPLYSDDFNTSIYDGSYNESMWSIYQIGLGRGNVVQYSGIMAFSINEKDSEIGVTLNLDRKYTFDSQIYTEASLMVGEYANDAQFGMEINIAQGWAGCYIKAESTDQICCHTFLSPTSGIILGPETCQQITPGTWHKVRIEISETTPNTIAFFIDDKNIDQYVSGPDWNIMENKLGGIKFALTTHSNKPGLAYLDDFSFGPVK